MLDTRYWIHDTRFWMDAVQVSKIFGNDIDVYTKIAIGVLNGTCALCCNRNMSRLKVLF